MREVQKGTAFVKSVTSSRFWDRVVNQQKCLAFYTRLSSKMAVVKNQGENRHPLVSFGNFYFIFCFKINALPLCSWCLQPRWSLSESIFQRWNLWPSARERNICHIACCGEIPWWEVFLPCMYFSGLPFSLLVKEGFPLWSSRVAEHMTSDTGQVRLMVTCTQPGGGWHCTLCRATWSWHLGTEWTTRGSGRQAS